VAQLKLAANERTIVGKKVRQLRKQGIVPGTIYGPATDPVNVSFPYRELEVALMKAGGTNIIDIEVDGATYPVLARDIQRDVLRGDILHADFFAVDMNTKIRAEIPLYIVGDSPLVVARKAVLLPGPNSLTAEMLPNRLINSIEVDVSVLKEIGDTIYVKDLHLGEDVAILNDPDEMVAKIVQPAAARSEERAEELTAVDGEGGEEGEDESGEDNE
jgi:large subunit ribosomal protein L25